MMIELNETRKAKQKKHKKLTLVQKIELSPFQKLELHGKYPFKLVFDVLILLFTTWQIYSLLGIFPNKNK